MPRKTEEAEMDAHYAHIVRSFQLKAPHDTRAYVSSPMSTSPPRDDAYMLHLPHLMHIHDGPTRTVKPSIVLFDTNRVCVINPATPVRIHLSITARKRLARATTKAMAGVEVLIGGLEPTPILPIGLPYTFLHFSPSKVLPKRRKQV